MGSWIVLVECLIPGVWMAVAPPVPTSMYVVDRSNATTLYEYKVCRQQASASSNSEDEGDGLPAEQALLLTSILLNGLLVVIGVVLAIQTRNISSRFSESS